MKHKILTLFILCTSIITSQELFSSDEVMHSQSLSDTTETIYERLDRALNNENNLPPTVYSIEKQDYELMKFLIDMGEDLEKAAPGTPVYWYDPYLTFLGYHSSMRPLEYAIKLHDIEAARILLEYHPEHQALANITRTLYINVEGPVVHMYHTSPQGTWIENGDRYSWMTDNTPLKHGPGYLIKCCTTREESALEFANECNSAPEMIYLLLKHNPNVNLTKIAENYRASHKLTFLASTLQVMHQKWKNESIEIDENNLILMEQCSLTAAIENNDQQLVSIYVKYGWEIEASDIILAIDNLPVMQELLSGNISSLLGLEILVKHKANWETIKAQVERVDDLDQALRIALRFEDFSLTQYLVSLDASVSEDQMQQVLESGNDQIALLLLQHVVQRIDNVKCMDLWLLTAIKSDCREVVKEILTRNKYSNKGLQEAKKAAYEKRNYVLLELLTG